VELLTRLYQSFYPAVYQNNVPDLPSERTALLKVRVLRCDLDLRVGHRSLDSEQIKRRGSNDDLYNPFSRQPKVLLHRSETAMRASDAGDEKDVPVLGSNSALLRPSTSSLALLSEVGLSFQFPPTKN